ncbi:MAG TPA: MoaD/ThiS family protein [Candidatus Sulfomarinibacteraceae bacterium]|nr:MoaD/ThiS family protein [Candidatus Sulfomarinibacteraceae bacterium]
MKTISVRVNGALAQQIGSSHVQVALAEGHTVADLLDALCRQHPSSSDLIRRAIPVIQGNHVSPDAALPAGHQISLLMPVAGG